MNDIISFHIINSWRKNLIGEIPLGTTFEICLWATPNITVGEIDQNKQHI